MKVTWRQLPTVLFEDEVLDKAFSRARKAADRVDDSNRVFRTRKQMTQTNDDAKITEAEKQATQQHGGTITQVQNDTAPRRHTITTLARH